MTSHRTSGWRFAIWTAVGVLVLAVASLAMPMASSADVSTSADPTASTPTPASTLTPIPIIEDYPVCPGVIDPPGPNNAMWDVPTKGAFDWVVRGDGHLIATIKAVNTVFPDRGTSYDCRVALDSWVAPPVTTPVVTTTSASESPPPPVTTVEPPPGIIPAAPAFSDNGDGTGTVTIPSQDGMQYTVNGEATPTGVHPGTGAVWVVALFIEGNEPAKGATTEWSHTFPGAPVVTTPVVTTPATTTPATTTPTTAPTTLSSVSSSGSTTTSTVAAVLVEVAATSPEAASPAPVADDVVVGDIDRDRPYPTGSKNGGPGDRFPVGLTLTLAFIVGVAVIVVARWRRQSPPR